MSERATKEVTRKVVRAGVSPMNPKVKWGQLECGHDIYRPRKPRIGSTAVCDICTRGSKERP